MTDKHAISLHIPVAKDGVEDMGEESGHSSHCTCSIEVIAGGHLRREGKIERRMIEVRTRRERELHWASVGEVLN